MEAPWLRPLPKKLKKVHSVGKVMASIFLDCHGVIWDCQGVIILSKVIDKQFILCRRIEAATPGNR